MSRIDRHRARSRRVRGAGCPLALDLADASETPPHGRSRASASRRATGLGRSPHALSSIILDWSNIRHRVGGGRRLPGNGRSSIACWRAAPRSACRRSCTCDQRGRLHALAILPWPPPRCGEPVLVARICPSTTYSGSDSGSRTDGRNGGSWLVCLGRRRRRATRTRPIVRAGPPGRFPTTHALAGAVD